MAEVINGLVFTNIADLDEIDEIQDGEYLIVETPDGTRIINFQNFLIPIENTTFEQTIEDIQTDISSLSSDYVETKSGYLTVGYTLSGGLSGVQFTGNAYELPINWIESNTIDNNFTNGNSTLNGITSASNVINLNTGSYYVNFNAAFDNSVFVDLYDTTNSRIVLTSNYSSAPSIKGVFSLSQRSQLTFRAYTNTVTVLGEALPFYVDGLITSPLVASFQYLTNTSVTTNQPDKRVT